MIKALLEHHPKGAEKSKGMTGIKVAQSTQGENSCFFMVKDDGTAEDFSAKKCLDAVEVNPPYVKDTPPPAKKPEAAAEKPKEAAAPKELDAAAAPASAEAPVVAKAEEKKEETPAVAGSAPKAEDKPEAPKAEAKAEEAAKQDMLTWTEGEGERDL